MAALYEVAAESRVLHGVDQVTQILVQAIMTTIHRHAE
jgi:hypothetical protein